MNIRTRFLTFLAAAAAVFTGCQEQEVDFDLPSIKIEGSGITVDNETKKASFSATKDLTAITLSVTATRDWKAEIEWDADEVPWINVSPEEGVGTGRAQDVKVTILDNAGYNRAKQIKFNINYDYKTLYITQSGEKGEEIVGTLDNPFTVAGVNKYVKTLGSDVQSPNEVYVKGKISQIADAGTFTEGGTFGNATFYISDDGTQNNEFYCYRILYLGNKKFKAGQTDIKVGDDVIVCGKVVNYKGNTPETVQGSAFLYELNGVSDGGEPTPAGDPKGTGTVDDPYNPAGAANAVKDLTWTSNDVYETTGDVYVKGIITRIADKGTFTEGGTFGNASFYISEDGTSAGEFYCYRILYLGNKKFTSGQTDIKVGDEVVICGQLMNYRGNTPETVAGKAYLYSLNGDTGGGVTPPGPSGEAKGTGTLEDPYNALGAANAVKNLTWTSNDVYDATGDVYVKGKISRIADKGTFTEGGTYGNASFYISDDGTQKDEFYCYRILYLGNKKFESGQTDIKVGDEVIVLGQLMNYRGNTPETVAGKAHLYSLNGKTEGGDTPPGPSGEVKAVTVAEFNAAPDSDTQVYELVGTIGGNINPTYGNFDLTDDTGTVYVYGLTATELGYGAKNDKSYASLGLAEGDKIKIHGYRGTYTNANTGETKIEVMYAWFIEKVDGGGDTPDPAGVKAVTVAEFNAAPDSDTQVYELVGTIGGNINPTYGNFDLTDDTGTVYVYGLTATELGYGAKNDKSYASLGLAEGDKIKIRGYRGTYTNANTGESKIEVMYAWFIEKVDGGGDTPDPAGVKAVTIAEFNAAPDSDTQVYELVGTIGGSINPTYGNFDLTDDTGTVYVYGLTATELGYGAKNDKSYASLGLAEGDKIKIRGYRGTYTNANTGESKIEVMYAWFIEKVGGDTPGGDTPGGDTPAGDAISFPTNLTAQTWTSETDGTYGEGFSSTTQDIKVGYYKHASTSKPVEPKDAEVRIYKGSVLAVTAPSGKKFKKIVIGTPGTGSGQYCVNMAGLEGGGKGTADQSALTVTWTGSASKLVLQADSAQVRMEKLTVEFE
ncbi:MAG: hypothetical protein IKM75_10110 [Bacteroidales bacterium]|nr:hypothetical protein [Bacteroidales bacterium]